MAQVRLNYAADGSDQFTPAMLKAGFRCCFVSLQDKEPHRAAARCSTMRPSPRSSPEGEERKRIAGLAFDLSLRERKPSAAGEGVLCCEILFSFCSWRGRAVIASLDAALEAKTHPDWRCKDVRLRLHARKAEAS